MPTQKLSAEIIQAAIQGFELQKQRIDAQIAELRQMLRDYHAPATAAKESARPRPKMSAAARKRIAAAQRARWAKLKTEAGPSQKATAAGGKAREATKERRITKR